MEQNKIRAYIFYAVGEILLVVIGILLALQINNWNQQRINNNLEEYYLELLSEELQNNIEFIQWFYLDRYDRKKDALEMLRSYYQGEYKIRDSTKFALELGYGAVFGTQAFQISTAVFDEIISTGNLGIIQDEELRKELIGYYSEYETLLVSLRDYDSGYLQAINSYRPFDGEKPDSISHFDRALVIKMAKTEELYTMATAELTYAYQAVAFMLRIRENAENIIALIDELMVNRKDA
jgi:hypothetical protein